MEIVTKRNDHFVNSRICSVTEGWPANTDFQLVLDPGKVAEYMTTKYFTKADTQMGNRVSMISENALKRSMQRGDAVSGALRRQ